MKYTLILLLFVFNLNSIELIDIDKTKVDLNLNNSLIIFLNNYNCKDCIPKLGKYLKANSVDKSKIIYVIETYQSVHARINLLKLIQKNTRYYSKILFNPKGIEIRDTVNSYFQKHTGNNYTPSILILGKEKEYLGYSDIFDNDGNVILDKGLLTNFVK